MGYITSATETETKIATQARALTKESTDTTSSTTDATSESTETEFSKFLSELLGKSGSQEVNEEELFSGLIAEQLNEQSSEASAYYLEQVGSLSTTMAWDNGYVPVEDVAKEALQATVDAGYVTKDDAELINAKAFTAAQLDSNSECLFDGRGDTCAVATMEEALYKMQTVFDAIEDGTTTVTARSLDIFSNVGTTPGTKVTAEQAERSSSTVASTSSASESSDSSGLSEKQVRLSWKEVASDGNLALLLPTRLNGQVDSVAIYKDGILIEEGEYSKQTGDSRAVYRFDEPGKEYGEDLDVVITKEDGDTLTYHVDDGSKRTYVAQDDYEENSSSAAS